MLQHLSIFFYVIVVLVGTVSLAISTFIYAKTRDRLLHSYIMFSSAFASFTIIYLLFLTYVNLNMPDASFSVVMFIVIAGPLSVYLLMFSILRFTHCLVLERPSRKRDLTAAGLSLIGYLSAMSAIRVDFVQEEFLQVRNFGFYFSLTLFYLTIAYTIFLKIFYLRRLDSERKRIARGMLLLGVFFFPGFIFDLYLHSRHSVFVFTPVFYCAANILFTIHITRTYLVALKSFAADFSEESSDRLLAEAGVSSREKEIVVLMLRGFSNKRIADVLSISLNTVKTHNRNIFQKLDVRSRFEMMAKLKSIQPE